MIDELVEKLKKINYQERLKLLDNHDFLNQIFLLDKKDNLFNFKKVLEVYEVLDLIKYFTKDIIDKIIATHYHSFLYLEALKLKDEEVFENAIKYNNDLLEFLLYKGENIYINLNFSYDTIIYIINYMKENNIDYRKTCLNSIIRYSIIDKELQERFLNDKSIDNFYKIKSFSLFDKELVSNYIQTNIINLNVFDIYDLLRYTRVDLNPVLYENEEFMEKIILGKTFYDTRKNIDYLSYNIDTSYFLNKLGKIESQIINLYNPNIIEYSNKDILISTILDKEYSDMFESKEMITKKILFQIVIDKFFEDSIRNVCLNIKEVLDFNKNNKVLSKEKIQFYQEIIDLFDKDSIDIINFYYKYKDSTLVSNFYDDVNICKQVSYQMLKDSCLKIEDIKDLKNKELSKNYNIDIYELDGIPFTMLVTCRGSIPKGKARCNRNCYSIIGDNNLKVFNERGYIYGFNEFDINNIMHVYEADSYSTNEKNNTTIVVNRIRTVEEILNSGKMNEVQIINEKINEGEFVRLFPNYVICFNEINEKSIKAARNLNIPIIIIHKDKYKENSNPQVLDNYEEEYTTRVSDETTYQNKKL